MNIVIFFIVILTVTITLVQLRTVEQREIEENDIPTNYENEKCKCKNYCPLGLENFYILASCSPINGSTVYFECQPSSCSTKYCPPNQLFSFLTKKCEYCSPGFRVDKTGQLCRCNEGTTLDRMSSLDKCVPCPEGAILEEDYCYCPAGKIHDDVNHVCRDCPEDSKVYLGTCRCRNNTFSFSEVELTCKECPGVTVENDDKEAMYNSFCHCQGENEVFHRWSATCVPCPPDSVSQIYLGKFQYCHCTGEKMLYNNLKKICVEYQ